MASDGAGSTDSEVTTDEEFAEAVAAMHENRHYSAPLDKATIIDELREGSGHQFDPEIASLAVEAIKEGLFEDLDDR